MEKGTYSEGTYSSAKNTPKFIRPICRKGPKVWNIVKKGLYWASVISEFCERKFCVGIYSKCQWDGKVKEEEVSIMGSGLL